MSEGELRVGEAHIPLTLLGDVEIISPADRRAAMGRELDPAAFVMHRGWIKPMVRVRLTDPEDPTPYWLVSTRRPEELAAALKG